MDDLTHPASARVFRAFAFLDLCGFTLYSDQQGDAAAVAVLGQFRAEVRAACSRHGVRVAKWLGDGAMIVGVEVAPVARAAHEVVSGRGESGVVLPVRGGLAWGDVIVFEGDDYLGRIVNLAARLSDLAQPDEVLAAGALATGLPPDLVIRRRDPVAVSGLRGVVEVGTLEAAGADRSAPYHRQRAG